MVAAYRQICSGTYFFQQPGKQALAANNPQMLKSRAQMKKMFLSEVFQSTMNELQKSRDVEVRKIAAEKVLFLIHE